MCATTSLPTVEGVKMFRPASCLISLEFKLQGVFLSSLTVNIYPTQFPEARYVAHCRFLNGSPDWYILSGKKTQKRRGRPMWLVVMVRLISVWTAARMENETDACNATLKFCRHILLSNDSRFAWFSVQDKCATTRKDSAYFWLDHGTSVSSNAMDNIN